MFERILVPLDGSDLAEAILPLVQEMAWTHKSTVQLIRVVRSPRTTESTRSEDMMVLNQQVVSVMEQDAHNYLAGKKGQLRQVNIPVSTKVIVSEMPASTILDYAEEEEADLIAMSTHGRSGIRRWVYGSVAEKILQGASCPVLLVRSQQPD